MTPPPSPRSADAGKELVQAAFVGTEGEAAMIQGVLETAGIPSFLRTTGVDGPRLGQELLPSSPSPRQVIVRASRLEEARSVIAEARTAGEMEGSTGAGSLEPGTGRGPRRYGVLGAYARMYLWGFGGMALAFGAFLLLRVL